MPDAEGRIRGISVPADAWERIFGTVTVTRAELEQQDWGTHDAARLRLLKDREDDA